MSRPEKLFDLPVPHIYPDASVSDIRVKAHECPADLSFGGYICYGEGGRDDMVTFATPDHARALARALLVAADALDKYAAGK